MASPYPFNVPSLIATHGDAIRPTMLEAFPQLALNIVAGSPLIPQAASEAESLVIILEAAKNIPFEVLEAAKDRAFLIRLMHACHRGGINIRPIERIFRTQSA